MNTTQDFIEEYFPNYSSSQAIVGLNDLQKLIDNEFEEGDCAHSLLTDVYMDNIDNPRIREDYGQLLLEVYNTSIQGFLKSL